MPGPGAEAMLLSPSKELSVPPTRLLVLALLVAVGCSSKEKKDETPVTMLPQVTTFLTATIGSRNVVVQRTDKIYGLYGEIRVTYELRDAVTQEPLHTWASMYDGYCPGVSCVLVLGHFGLMEIEPRELDDFYGANNLYSPEKAQRIYDSLRWHRDWPAARLPRWRRLDLETRKLVDTDVVFISNVVNGPAGTFEVTSRLPDEKLGDRTIGRLDIELINTAGESLGRYERASFPSLPAADGLRLVRTHRADGTEVNHVLGPRLERLSVSERPTMVVNGIFIATQAPGTTPEQNLWIFAKPNGQFVVPPGIVGYRPVWAGGGPASGRALFFLVRHADPAPHPWGRTEAMLTGSTGPIWDSAELYAPPTLHRSFRFENIRTDEYLKLREGYVSPIDNPVLVVQAGGKWETSSTVPGTAKDPSITTSGETLDEALTASFALYEKRFASLQETARWENYDNKNRRYFDDWVGGRIDESKVDIGRIEYLAKKYGGVAVFHYVRYLYSRMTKDTLYNMKPYFDWAAENASKSDVSDGDRAWLKAEYPRVNKARADADAAAVRAALASEEQRRHQIEAEERRREIWASPMPASGGAAPSYTPSSSGSSAPRAYESYYNKQYDDTIRRYGR